MQRYLVPEAACNIRKRSVFKTSIRGRLIESATIAAKIVNTVFDSKHITYIICLLKEHNSRAVESKTYSEV